MRAWRNAFGQAAAALAMLARLVWQMLRVLFDLVLWVLGLLLHVARVVWQRPEIQRPFQPFFRLEARIGRWLNRIELPARAGTMSICMPVPAAGDYAIAVRHDVNDNGETDISTDGGGMSNNPSINIFNLGRPSINRTKFTIGREVKPMAIRMRYL